MKRPGIPVVMYHSVGPRKPGWDWNHLVTPLDVFEGQLEALTRTGWTTISLQQLHVHLLKGRELPLRSVVLTFDDGYLDNFTLAWPLLKKHGHRAVIYVSLDFIDPSTRPRSTLEDVWDETCVLEDIDYQGFLSAAEMRLMIQSGHVEIQSHAVTHTWYPNSSTIVDFHRPRGLDGYRAPYWLGWNNQPERKFAYLTEDLSRDLPWGTPIHEARKALESPRCELPPELRLAATEFVAANGGAEFFGTDRWEERLRIALEGQVSAPAQMESEDRFLARVRDELARSKSGLEELTGQAIEFLCWPGGGRNPRVLSQVEEVGYRSSTTHFCDLVRKNTCGQDPTETNRIGSGSPWVWRGRIYHRTPPELFIASLEDFAGFPGSRRRLRMVKAKALLGQVFRSSARRGTP